ncbi:hypothetical protein Pint_16538 [Pistacia integerrima]|uniref:Uncharacterized protein n=1 Tax=Pistacia integerrima TaxID=434235 RepID=A0ACC0ZDW6_9ROSI|nr:hypothetical protein Pint_16538 [Pistacia integerrima]
MRRTLLKNVSLLMRNLLQNPNPNASLIPLAASTRSPLRLYSSDSNDSSIDQDLPASAAESTLAAQTQEKDVSLDVQDVGNKDLRNKLAWILEDAIIKYGLARDGESGGESDDESDYQANYQSDEEYDGRRICRTEKEMLCDLVRWGHIPNPAEKWLRDAVRRGHLDIHEIPEPGDYELVGESDDEDKDYQSTGK